MIKGMDSMDIDFLSNLRDMRNVTFQLFGYPSLCVRNKKIRIDKQTNTFSGAAIVVTISVCTVCVHYPSFLCQ